MPSNRELRREIEALSEELGVSVSTSGMSNAKLTQLAEDLRSQQSGSESAEPAEKSSEPEQPRFSSLTRSSSPAPASVSSEQKPSASASSGSSPSPSPAASPAGSEQSKPLAGKYYIAPGKTCTSRRGILESGTEVRPEYFSGGKRTLGELVDKGIVIKR